MTRSLGDLANRLVDLRVERVVMEATSDYWRPVFYMLEAHGSFSLVAITASSSSHWS